jgi:2,5-diketo-D-gluconate reductase B
MEHSSLNLPKIGFGTWQLTGKSCETAVGQALDIGYRLIDTAQMYRNEESVGKAIAKSSIAREDLTIATKVWNSNLSPKNVIKSTEKSLKKLGLSYVDILYIHWPSKIFNTTKTLKAFEELRQQGKIRQIAVSNFTPALLEEVTRFSASAKDPEGKIHLNQVEHHPLLQQKPLREYMSKHDMQVVAYTPLARGHLRDVPAIKHLVENHPAHPSPEQVALAWEMHHGALPIPRSSSADHMRSNFDAQFLQLTEVDIAHIDAISRTKRFLNPPLISPKW